MNLKPKPSLYFRLIDIAFIVHTINLLSVIATKMGAMNLGKDGYIYYSYVSWVAGMLSLFLIIFLVLARFMRDEYTEQIWQRSAGSFVRALTVLPLLFYILSYVFLPQITEYLGGNAIPQSGAPQNTGQTAQYSFFLMAAWVSLFFATYVPYLFICLFQWHRWKASR